MKQAERSEMMCHARPTNVLLLLACLAISGCGPDRADDVSSADRPRIALIMKSLANEFFATMEAGARQHQAEHATSYELIVNGIKDERDLTRQVAIVDEMVALGVDAIVIAPADSKALVPALKRAMDAGVVVVNIDNRLDADVLSAANVQIPFVGPDNRRGARAVAEHLASHLNADAKVAILEGIRTSFNGQQRRLGFEDAMQAANIQIVDSQSAQWEMNEANRIASAMLTKHPDLNALLACNDSMALGALAAARAAERDDLLIIGFDNISATQQEIQAGRILATADQHGDQLAVFGIEYALARLSDPSTTLTDQETPVDLITQDDLTTSEPGRETR